MNSTRGIWKSEERTISARLLYPEGRNKAIELMANGEILAKAGETLLTSKNHLTPAVITISASVIEKFAPFTVVKAAPLSGTFMPPAFGKIKFELNENDAQMNLLASLARPPAAPAYDVASLNTQLTTVMYNPYASYGYAYRQTAACAQPSNTECTNYGGGYHHLEGQSMFAINTDLSVTDKRSMLNLLTGWAISWYGQNLTFWGSRASNGGQQAGDILAPFIGHIYNHHALKNRIVNGREPGIYDQVEEITPAIVANTSLNYTPALLGAFDFKMHATALPYNYWSTAFNPYKFCCTMVYWVDSLLAARVMNVTPLFRNNGIFRYMNRYLDPMINPNTNNMYANPQMQYFYQQYGSSYPAP